MGPDVATLHRASGSRDYAHGSRVTSCTHCVEPLLRCRRGGGLGGRDQFRRTLPLCVCNAPACVYFRSVPAFTCLSLQARHTSPPGETTLPAPPNIEPLRIPRTVPRPSGQPVVLDGFPTCLSPDSFEMDANLYRIIHGSPSKLVPPHPPCVRHTRTTGRGPARGGQGLYR